MSHPEENANILLEHHLILFEEYMTLEEHRSPYHLEMQRLEQNINIIDQQLEDDQREMKILHNTLMDLKGNIRIFCRVRPLLDHEGQRGKKVIISYPDSIEAQGRRVCLVRKGKEHVFTFDRVFNHEASQEEVFIEISQLVQSALDGYKVCIFAYGQTGSGKTYTMMGRPEMPEQKGVIPRTFEKIFEVSQSRGEQGWKYTMQVSILEIYKESIRDLLSQDPTPHVREFTVCNMGDVSSLLQQAAERRSVGKTLMNEQSSRSHCVVTIRISGVNESTEEKLEGVVNLIDLAGSQRVEKTRATGEQLEELQAINKSISALSGVIFAIAEKEDHVPFRNSKLTHLLQPCLEGDSEKTLVIVNISPVAASAGESLFSLQFGARANYYCP